MNPTKAISVEALLDKAVLTMNGAELLELLHQAKRSETKEEIKYPPVDSYSNLPQFVTGIKALAQILGISVSTVSRMKADGLLDDAVFQNGKTVIFDTHKVLEILRVSNKKVKFNTKN
ncbi:DUF3853 family protein [Bacteroides clarus]|uniref:DUF3853 family protein n=1 Tax=Bacteroides clarus TaxID=626929 RepID=A0A1Y3Z170_9BACE|nr:DUF3853 family protein [Bacteroides clarus]OUO01350.1 hypothetical protein B5F97_06715 [Bacteroides clarus]